MKLKDSKTFTLLAKAYAGECQARTRYEFIEYGARMQGYKAMSEIIDRIIFNEFNHARMLYTKIQDAEMPEVKNIEISGDFPFKEKWDLERNLKLAADDEESEVKLYAEFSKIAKDEGFTEIATLFTNIGKIESEHYKTFTRLYEGLKNETLYKKDKKTLWKCTHCGHVYYGLEAPKTCPVCNEKQGSFEIDI